MTSPESTPTTANARSARSAGVAALWVVIILTAISVIQFLFSTLPFGLLYTPADGGNDPGNDFAGPSQWFAATASGLGNELALRTLPFAIGVWISLWLLAPVRPTDGLRRVIFRGLIASVVGAAAVTAVSIVSAVVQLQWGNPISSLLIAILGTVSLAATWAPVVLLVLVVRRFALRRESAESV